MIVDKFREFNVKVTCSGCSIKTSHQSSAHSDSSPGSQTPLPQLIQGIQNGGLVSRYNDKLGHMDNTYHSLMSLCLHCLSISSSTAMQISAVQVLLSSQSVSAVVKLHSGCGGPGTLLND